MAAGGVSIEVFVLQHHVVGREARYVVNTVEQLVAGVWKANARSIH